MPQFGRASFDRLATCSPNIQRVMNRAIAYPRGPDFGVISARRTVAEQAEKVRLGYSKTMNSAHVADPPALSKAIDIGPYIPEWGELIVGSDAQVKRIAARTGFKEEGVRIRIWKQYGMLAGWILHVAESVGVELIYGGDWDRDWNAIENNFEDLGHFEEPRP